MRWSLISCLVTLAVLAGCVGDTQPPSGVQANQVDLQARGRTDNGPASWWWEYGEVRKRVKNGQGTKTPRQGPAASATDFSVSWRVTGLDEGQTYFYRACAQDQAAGSAVGCGRIYEFTTAPADSTAFGVDGQAATFTGATTVRHDLEISDVDSVTVKFEENGNEATAPLTGSFIGGATCSGVTPNSFDYVSAVTCRHGNPYPQVRVTLGPFVDKVVSTTAWAVRVEAGAGNDDIQTGAGSDILVGGEGNDVLKGGAAFDEFYCGPGQDTIYGSVGEFNFSTDCETLVGA